MSRETILFALYLSAALAGVGVYGLFARRNIVFVVMSIELLFNAAILALVALTAAGLVGLNGIAAVLFFLAVGVSEVAVGFALAIAMLRTRRSADVTEFSELRG
jgi:NADH-quinone oxidoreductase subunit K